MRERIAFKKGRVTKDGYLEKTTQGKRVKKATLIKKGRNLDSPGRGDTAKMQGVRKNRMLKKETP